MKRTSRDAWSLHLCECVNSGQEVPESFPLLFGGGERKRTAPPAGPGWEGADEAWLLFEEAAVLDGSLQTYSIFGDFARL